MLNRTIYFHFKFSFLFFVMALFFGFFYSLNLLGYGSELLNPTYALSLHISLMLYGFPSLMLSMLPFALFNKDKLEDEKGAYYLNLYFIVWYIFLIFMIMSLLFGNQRGLVFYDYPYELNFLLAFSGLFFLLSILRYISHYKVKPLWVKVSLATVILAPFLLVLLMNPEYGQVENMAMGPHGDNTLGMSFALLVFYYLVIKLHSKIEFRSRFNWLWIVPMVAYVISVFYRMFIGSLSYEEEWFLQWLTFLYIPTLYFWFKDAKLNIKENMFLYISILSFLFVDIEGNILFIPEIRELFHRNDLVVGHAHIAVGISMLFLSFSVVKSYFNINNKMILLWASMLILMAGALSLSGFAQAGFIPLETSNMWILRSFYGFLLLCLVLFFYLFNFKLKTFSKLEFYHLSGFMTDGLGAIFLLLFAPFVYKILGIEYSIGYQSVVYGFMLAIGIMHFLGYINKEWATPMAIATAISRIIVSAIFFALYKVGTLDWIALGVSIYDLIYAFIYILFLYNREKNEIS